MDEGLTLHTGSLTYPHRKNLQRLQSGKCRGQETSDCHKMIPPHLSRFKSSEQMRHLVVTDELLPARPDHEQIIENLGDINADLPASSTIHFTTSHFPYMSQTNSCHYRAIPLSLTASLSSGYYGTQET